MLYYAKFYEANKQMKEAVDRIDAEHRKELLKFLLVKTAAVRRGVKPGELLRVRHCYETNNAEGLKICLYRSDIYGILGLDYVELKVEEGSSLVLFYNAQALKATLAERRNRRWLERRGYPKDSALDGMIAELRRRAQGTELPHEVGIFIGYPLKDVAGFMAKIPATPLHNGPWRVYGDARESLAKMRLYRSVEEAARAVLDDSRGIDDFIEKISYRKVG